MSKINHIADEEAENADEDDWIPDKIHSIQQKINSVEQRIRTEFCSTQEHYWSTTDQ